MLLLGNDVERTGCPPRATRFPSPDAASGEESGVGAVAMDDSNGRYSRQHLENFADSRCRP